MVIKTSILRRKRELGIQKAVGFTTFQLMNQIALNMTPVILLGVVIGAVGGYFGFNPILVVLIRSMGIVQMKLPVPLDWTILVCIALTALAYVVSMLVAWRIRKISAYSLVNE
jgi:putative ABC transport system permease protein